MNEGISLINNLTKFIKKTSGCSRKQSHRLANQYTSKLQDTTFFCDLKKYDDAIPIERVLKNCMRTMSIIGKDDSVTQKLNVVRKFLNNAAAEEEYLNTKCYSATHKKV